MGSGEELQWSVTSDQSVRAKEAADKRVITASFRKASLIGYSRPRFDWL